MTYSIDEILDLIDEPYKVENGWLGRTIGASGIGNECNAALVLGLRSFPEAEGSIAPRTRRIFKLGHVLEDMIVEDLKSAGFRVFEKDPLTGRQYTYTLAGGHVKCKLDGLIALNDDEDAPLDILEIKSMNDAYFKKFVRHGLAVSHPKYVAQAIMMMGMTGIKRTLIVAYNKNTSAYHAEVIEADDLAWAAMVVRINIALSGDAEKIAADEDDWRCKMCFKKHACWQLMHVEPTCRRCKFSQPSTTGYFECTKHGYEDAREVCSDYQMYEPRKKEVKPDVK